jgi:hypothetical protein
LLDGVHLGLIEGTEGADGAGEEVAPVRVRRYGVEGDEGAEAVLEGVLRTDGFAGLSFGSVGLGAVDAGLFGAGALCDYFGSFMTTYSF